ncbi:MAG: L-threonylcarbamoyladenylate synthase [Monoglobales bacterium]
METEFIKIDPENIDMDAMRLAGEIIAGGGLVAFPTETVYGLGASAVDSGAAEKIYTAKGRPSDNPLIVHVCSFEQIEELAENIPAYAKKLMQSFMPGPLTLILKKKSCIPDEVTANMDTVGIRFPSNPIAAALIKCSGVPIAAPSANISGKPSPTTARDVMEDMNGKIECIIDGGSCSVGVESTILDASGERPILLRPGGITVEMIKEICPELKIDAHVLKSVAPDEQPKCPGMKYKHYAPDAEVTVIEGEMENVRSKINELLKENKGRVTGVLTMYDSAYDDAVIINAGRQNSEYARNLFSDLREFDRLGVEVVFAEFCENDGVGLAVKNRLYKSAGGRVIHV